LGALLVAGLLLSAFVTDDALVMSLGRLLPILLAFLDRLITRHLPDDLFALSLGSVVKFAHSDLLLTIENGLTLQCFPSTHLILVAEAARAKTEGFFPLRTTANSTATEVLGRMYPASG
jgi:hypothetical protein